MVLFQDFFWQRKAVDFSGAVLKNLLKSIDICGNSYFGKTQTSLEGVSGSAPLRDSQKESEAKKKA